MAKRTKKSAKPNVCRCCGCARIVLIVAAVISLIVGIYSTYDVVFNYLPQAIPKYGMGYLARNYFFTIFGTLINANLLLGIAILCVLKLMKNR